MPRRASSSTHPVWIAVVFLLVIGAGAGGYFLYSTVSDPYRTVAPHEVDLYLENANSLRGNIYKVEGTISDQLAWSPSRGRLFSIEVGSDLLPLLVPADFNHVNMQKGQTFQFQIEVGDQGILRAQDVKKA